MKKSIGICMVFSLLIGSLFALTACSSYERVQTAEMMNGLPNCLGLHMTGARWHYVDINGNAIDVVGRCTQGRLHGNFDYSMNGIFVARAKFVNGAEYKTACFVGKKHQAILQACLNEAAMASQAQNQVPMQQSQTVLVPVQSGQAVMVPVQPGQTVLVPAQQQGQTVLVPAQSGQTIMIPVQQGQSAEVPVQQNQTPEQSAP